METIEIGSKLMSELTAENVMDIILLIGACPSLEFWNKPIITNFDNEMFRDAVVINYHSLRTSDNKNSCEYIFFFNFKSFNWHYTKYYEIYNKSQRNHSNNVSLKIFKYLISNGFDVPLY
jgi:hypothetical protein